MQMETASYGPHYALLVTIDQVLQRKLMFLERNSMRRCFLVNKRRKVRSSHCRAKMIASGPMHVTTRNSLDSFADDNVQRRQVGSMEYYGSVSFIGLRIVNTGPKIYNNLGTWSRNGICEVALLQYDESNTVSR